MTFVAWSKTSHLKYNNNVVILKFQNTECLLFLTENCNLIALIIIRKFRFSTSASYLAYVLVPKLMLTEIFYRDVGHVIVAMYISAISLDFHVNCCKHRNNIVE